MSLIMVTQDSESHGWKVLINFIQRGSVLSRPDMANNEAQRIHDREMPSAKLVLAQVAVAA